MQTKPLVNNDIGLKSVTIGSSHFAPLEIPVRPRYYYAPLHVAHAIEAVQIQAVANDPQAAIAVAGQAPAAGRAAAPVRLAVGRNLIPVVVTAPDGTARKESVLTVFRGCPLPAWKQISAANPWLPRDSAGELVFNGKMWLLGGYTPDLVSDVWSSADGRNWTQAGKVPAPKGLDIPVAFVFRDQMWVADVEGNLYSSADGAAWTLRAGDTPLQGRHAAGGAVFRGRVWIMGGVKNGRLRNDVWSSPDGVKWEQETECAPWPKRQIHNTPLVLGGKLWLIGGGTIGSLYHPFKAYNDVWNSADGKHWNLVTADAPWAARIWSSTVVYQNRLWLLGGFRSEPAWENFDDVWYSADGADWRQLPAVPLARHSGGNNVPVVVKSGWALRHESSVYVFEDAIWLAGGMVWPLVNDVWRLALPGLTFLTEPVLEGYAEALYAYKACADFNASRKPIFYRLVEGPPWLKVDRETGLILGVPPAIGAFQVAVEAADEGGSRARQDYQLHILPV